MLHLKIFGFLLDELVLFLRLGDVVCHLRSDRAEMIVEVLEDTLALGLLISLNLSVTLLELLVLPVVLAGDLLVLLSDDVCLITPVLVLQRLLVVELLLNLIVDRGHINDLK